MKTKPHYTEADLLETWYLGAGESLPAMLHLADCDVCRARYEKLEQKLRAAAACNTSQPETFWARQRHAIMRKIDEAPVRARGRRVRTWAAAAVVAVLAGTGVFVTRPGDTPVNAPLVNTAGSAAPTTEELLAQMEDFGDPWSADALHGYRQVVAWESWVTDATTGGTL